MILPGVTAHSAAVPPLKEHGLPLNYLRPPPSGEAPYIYHHTPPEGVPASTIEVESHEVTVNDLRGKEEYFDVNNAGFQVVRCPTKWTDWGDEEGIKEHYYKEVEELVKKTLGAERVFIFDHTIRRRSNADPSDPSQSDRPKARGPVSRVHVDQTPISGAARVFSVVQPASLATQLSKYRVQIINVWRPLRGPVQDVPLALMDYRSLGDGDLVVTEMRYEDRVGEMYSVKSDGNGKHQWWWLKDQQPEEVIFIKCYENLHPFLSAACAPHTAFVNRDAPNDTLERQSIEVRCLVCYGDGGNEGVKI